MTFGRPQTLMMSGAWPPPAPSVWKAWMVRPLKAATVFSTKPLSFSVSVWIITCTSYLSATDRQQSIAAGVVPQSSCSFSEQAPPSTISSSAAGSDALPLPDRPIFIGKASNDWIMRARCHGPGVQVVASVPCAGPVPPPSIVVMPDISASSICCGQMKWICASMPPAVRILPSPAMISVPGPMMMVTPACVSGLPALPIAAMRPSLRPISALKMPLAVDDQRVGDDGVDRAAGAGHLALAHAVADHLAAAELHLLAIDGEILLDLDEQLGVGEANLVARGRAEHLGIGSAGNLCRHISSTLLINLQMKETAVCPEACWSSVALFGHEITSE